MRERLAGGTEAEQVRILTDLVRSEAASVLGYDSTEEVAVDITFLEQGFDSLSAIKFRNRVNAITGLRLTATMAFDHPTPGELAPFLREKLAIAGVLSGGDEPPKVSLTGSAVAVGGGGGITFVDSPGLRRETRSPGRERAVLVVHGRDDQARDAVLGLLRKLDLHPLEWEDAVRATAGSAPYLGEVIAAAVSIAQVAIVLLTPDDIVMPHPALRDDNESAHEVLPSGQPSSSVLLELGMLLAASPDQTIIVQIGELRPIAELAGRKVIRLDGSAASLDELVSRLNLAGSPVNDIGAEWRDTGPFIGLAAHARRPG